MKINDDVFIDGSFESHNPAVAAYHEVEAINREGETRIALVLSIGTGGKHSTPQNTKSAIFRHSDSFKYMIRRGKTSTENGHHTMDILAARRGFAYHRLNVDTGLEGMQEDDWKSSIQFGSIVPQYPIEGATLEYLGKPEVQRELDELARNLVHQRRRRSQTHEWELFCGDYPRPPVQDE